MNEVEALKAENVRLTAELVETRAITFRYLQNVAHQLTAPLGAIKWSIEALKDERVPLSRKKTLLSSVYSQATILVHLIKNFALMSNLEADHELGQFREQPEPIDVMRLAINLANDFQPQAYDIGIKIAIDSDSFRQSVGARLLLIEKNLVSQALSNLIENAVKYADRDTTIKVFACKRNKTVCIAVESIGIPIPESDKGLLLDRGYRGASARQKVAAGTGIGLFLASRVMKFHGGSIALETSGRLSRFILVFPDKSLTGEK
jgi:signal transduction histidine kinase